MKLEQPLFCLCLISSHSSWPESSMQNAVTPQNHRQRRATCVPPVPHLSLCVPMVKVLSELLTLWLLGFCCCLFLIRVSSTRLSCGIFIYFCFVWPHPHLPALRPRLSPSSSGIPLTLQCHMHSVALLLYILKLSPFLSWAPFLFDDLTPSH